MLKINDETIETLKAVYLSEYKNNKVKKIVADEAVEGFYEVWGEALSHEADNITSTVLEGIKNDLKVDDEAVEGLYDEVFNEAVEGLSYQAVYYNKDVEAFKAYVEGLIGFKFNYDNDIEGGITNVYFYYIEADDFYETIETIASETPAENFRNWVDIKNNLKNWADEIKNKLTPVKGLKNDEAGFSLVELVLTLSIGLTIIGIGGGFYLSAASSLTDRAVELKTVELERVEMLTP
jgi:hypothetical protein